MSGFSIAAKLLISLLFGAGVSFECRHVAIDVCIHIDMAKERYPSTGTS